MKKSHLLRAALAAAAFSLFAGGCTTPPSVGAATASASHPALAAPDVIETLSTMSAVFRAKGGTRGTLLSRDFEVSSGTTNTNFYMGVITVHLTSEVFGTKYIELNFYNPARTFAYYQDGRFHLGYGSEMFGAIHEMLRSERPIYFYFDTDVLQGLDPSGHSDLAKFGFLTTQSVWPY